MKGITKAIAKTLVLPRFARRPSLACSSLLILWATGCSLFAVEESPENTDPLDQGFLVTDTQVTVDDYGFREAACLEVVPAGHGNPSAPDSGEGLALTLIATACWRASVLVVDAEGVAIDSFTQAFAIWGRKDGDKERGEVGYLVWKSGDGFAASPRPLVWHIRLDFGLGRMLRLRALIE